ncbi:MAG TPA: tripartite tricarboxylate transporter substrate-binding protein, partial [Thalassobaculum sp.]
GPARAPDLPDVPTLEESGVDLEFTVDRGVMLPKTAAPELVARYATLFENALHDPQVTALLAQYGTSAAFLGPGAYAGYWQDSFAHWRALAKAAGIYRQAD